MDREHPEAEREMPQSLERASSRVYISELWKLAILIQHPSKFLLNCECLEGNRNTYYPKHTYAHDQAKKAKERKSPGKSPDGGKRRHLGESEERRREHVVRVSTFAHPSSLLPVVLDASNCFSSGFNQRLTTSVRWEAYVILVLEYRQVCT